MGCEIKDKPRAKRGDGHINVNGYMELCINGKIILEHRHVVENRIGRKLKSDEHVHHKDGIKLHNEISNLVIMTNSDHRKHHEDKKALNACGHQDWRKCTYCNEYDSTENMIKMQRRHYHGSCRNAYRRKLHTEGRKR